MAQGKCGLFRVTHCGVSVEFALYYGVKTNADKGIERSQDFICVRFREYALAEHGYHPDENYVNYIDLSIEWVRAASEAEAHSAPPPPESDFGCNSLFS